MPWYFGIPFGVPARIRVTMVHTETLVQFLTHARVTMAYTETVVKP